MLGHYLKIGQHHSLLDVTCLLLSAVAQEWDHKLSKSCHSVFGYSLITDKICPLKVFLEVNQYYILWLDCSYIADYPLSEAQRKNVGVVCIHVYLHLRHPDLILL
jgi:hypothetical protein